MEKPDELSFLNVIPRPKPYQTGVLEGHTFSDALRFTGIQGVARHEAMIDFSSELAEQWKRKIKLMQNKGSFSHQNRDSIKGLFASYDAASPEKTDLVSYRQRLSHAIETTRSNVRLEGIGRLARFRDFSPVQIEALHALERRINATALLSYSTTEIMPTSGREAKIGIDIYDWLLHSAGQEYIENGRPALGDALLSFGPYQLTSSVLRAKDGSPDGARLIETLASHQSLPADIGALRGADHHKAAYLFAVHNLALLVRRLNENRSHELVKFLPNMPFDLVAEYIAVSHHNPQRTMNVFEDYLYKYKAAVEHPTKYKRPDFAECCAPEGDLGPYARKTRGNLQALREHFGKIKAVSR